MHQDFHSKESHYALLVSSADTGSQMAWTEVFVTGQQTGLGDLYS